MEGSMEDNLKYLNVDDLIPYENNPRNNDGAVDYVAKSIEEFGFKVPIVVDKNNVIVAGHTRLKASKKLGLEKVPVIIADDLSDEKIKAFRLADNKVSELATWDDKALEKELEELELEIDMEEFGFEKAFETLADKVKNNPMNSNLFDTFVVPPFSILDTRQGAWQNRKKDWISLGIRSEVGRGDNLVFTKNLDMGNLKGTSIFDPVLCEIGYRWFMPSSGGTIIDPFAGGSVRGVVAERLGYNYKGIELRKEQVEANYQNAEEIGIDMSKLDWYCDDSLNVDNYIEDNSSDLIFACPPYFDLEVYSDDKKDISNMEYDEFVKIYSEILGKFANKLKDNRFAIVTISDVRDKKGFYRDLTGVTKEAFKDKGLNFYNDLILVNATGSAALRARKSMGNRKMVRTHQNVLVFFKGEVKNIKQDFEAMTEFDDIFLEEYGE